MTRILVLILLCFTFYSCEKNVDNNASIEIVSVSPEVSIAEYYTWENKLSHLEFHDSLIYHPGDTIAFDIEIEKRSSTSQFVDLILSSGWVYPYFWDFDEYDWYLESLKDTLNGSQNRGRNLGQEIYFFEYFFFEEGSVSIDFQYQIPDDFVSPSSTYYDEAIEDSVILREPIVLRLITDGLENLVREDQLNLRIYVLPEE